MVCGILLCYRIEEDTPDPGPVGMERHQRQLEAEANARRLAKEAEMELADEIAQKLFIQGEQLAERHHQEIEHLAVQQTSQTQRLSPEAQDRVKEMLKVQAAMAQGQGAIPKQPVKQGGKDGADPTKTIFKKLDE